jgi:hypothetical protein
MCTLYNRTYHCREFIIMSCVKNTPKSPIITREGSDKDDERKLFPNFVQYSRAEHSFYHVYEGLTGIVMQCLLLPNSEVLIIHGISEVTCQNFWDRWNRLWEGKTRTRKSVNNISSTRLGITPAHFLVHDKMHTDVGTTFWKFFQQANISSANTTVIHKIRKFNFQAIEHFHPLIGNYITG